MAASTARSHAARRARHRGHTPGALLLAGALLASLAACEGKAVSWTDADPVVTSQPSPLAAGAAAPMDSAMTDTSAIAAFLLEQDLLREAGARTMVEAHLDSMPASQTADGGPHAGHLPPAAVPAVAGSPLGSGDVPQDSMRCARSLRVASAGARGDVAVWWSRRDRGRVALVAAWRHGAPGTAWRGPLAVDTLDQGPEDAQAADRGSVGCARPAPSIAVSEGNGFVHVGYALRGPEGPGAFYAHQMEPTYPFEAMPIVYGEALGAVRVAASGNIVAVAYEDPNSGPRPRVSLAVSTTAGHSFEDRMTASSGTGSARDPHVTVRGKAIVMGWSEFPGAGSGEPTFRIRRAVVR